ncbi:MAG TPA: aminotransferase class IV [Solirubrobacterales bacterium]|nr:aminotransferase class IV [Solirubrobacterales bacterium]
MLEDCHRIGPDRSRGVFETLLVRAGEPVASAAHFERLAQSLRALYDADLPSGIEDSAASAAAGLSLGRLRITVLPKDGGLRFGLDAEALDPAVPFPRDGVRLAGYPVPGGLGGHKLADRPAAIEHPPADRPGALITDEGEVLEAGWANVFAVRTGTLFTPPLDGRLLPGTTRAAVLEIAAAHGIETSEQPLLPNDLLTADETFLTGSIRGIEPALSLDGAGLPGCGQLSRRLEAALRQRWGLGAPTAPAAAADAPRAGQLSR